jgi:raffinose/stachyose/melibiose transport system permease protein
MGVMDFMGEHATGGNLVLGYLTPAMIPAILLFILAQKHMVAGLTGGGSQGMGVKSRHRATRCA